MKAELLAEVRREFARTGSKARWAKTPIKGRAEAARKAVQVRWARYRAAKAATE